MRGPERPSERVERELRQLVSPLPPGTQLPVVRSLAATLGSSSETVRKVLRKLESEGIVTVVARWGVFVAEHE